jgi:hypothetical protein
MTIRSIITLSVIFISGCGLTLAQKQQIAQFATATESVSISTQDRLKSTRDKVIDLERRRLIMRNEAPPKKLDIDGGLSATGIATQVATLKALQSYGDVLNKLALNEQSEAISKAATELATQYEAAMKIHDTSYTLDKDKKDAVLGIVNIAGLWFIESEKKKHMKNIVIAYSPEVAKLSKLLINDLTLVEDSLCYDEKKRMERVTKIGVIDIYCTSADALKEKAFDVLTGKGFSFAEREFAYDSYVLAQQAIDEIVIMSDQGGKVVSKLSEANDKLSEIIKSDDYKTEDIKAYAQQVNELQTLTKILIGK